MNEKKKSNELDCFKAFVRIRPVSIDLKRQGVSPQALDLLQDKKVVNIETGECYEYGKCWIMEKRYLVKALATKKCTVK